MKRLIFYIAILFTILGSAAPFFSSFKGVERSALVADSFNKQEQFSNPVNIALYTIDLGTIVENDSDIDFFSLNNRFVPTPNYFFVIVYAGLLFQFFCFFKRRIPLCDYLAFTSQSTYLSKRVLLI